MLNVFKSWKRSRTANKCGHETKLSGKIHPFGQKIELDFTPTKESTTPDYCLECHEKMAIVCAWCGNIILPGSPITLYTPKKPKEFLLREGAVVYVRITENNPEPKLLREMPDLETLEGPFTVIGCLGWDCAHTGADRAGFWVSPGEVARVPTAYEQFLNGAAIVSVSDLNDIQEAAQTIPGG